MLVATFFIPQAFSYILFIAIAYFTLRLGLSFVFDSVNAWRNAKRAIEINQLKR